MIPAQDLYRLVRSITAGRARFDDVALVEDPREREVLLLDELVTQFELNILDVATLARVLAGEEPDLSFPVPAGYVATIYAVDRVDKIVETR